MNKFKSVVLLSFLYVGSQGAFSSGLPPLPTAVDLLQSAIDQRLEMINRCKDYFGSSSGRSDVLAAWSQELDKLREHAAADSAVAAQAYNREKILEFEKEQMEKQERAILIEERKNSDLIWEQEHKARHEQSMIELSALIGRNRREKKLENMFNEYFKWMKGEWTKFRNRQYAKPKKSGRAMVQRKYAQLVQLRAEGSDLHEALYAAKTIVEMDDILDNKLFANLNDRKALVE